MHFPGIGDPELRVALKKSEPSKRAHRQATCSGTFAERPAISDRQVPLRQMRAVLVPKDKEETLCAWSLLFRAL